MIVFTLLMITIGGIAAIPHVTLPAPDIDNNHLEVDSRSHNRTKRDSTNWSTLYGDQYSFSFSESDSNWTPLGTVFSLDPEFRYNKFKITRDLNYTNWDDFLKKYKWADFPEKFHIEFSRYDEQGTKYDVRILPQAIKLKNIETSYLDVEKTYDKEPTFYLHTKPTGGGSKADVMAYRDVPLSFYKQTIFDESIWFDLARVRAKVDISLEGFQKDNELILQLIIKLTHTHVLTTSGIKFKLSGYNEIVLK